MRKRMSAIVLCVCLLITMLPTYIHGEIENSNEIRVEESKDESRETSVGKISGTVVGLDETDYSSATVILYDAVNAYTSELDQTGSYAFQEVAVGNYYLKLEVAGYEIPMPESITISEDGELEQDITVTAVEGDGYFYQWKADETYFGCEESAKVPETKTFVFLNELVYVCDSNAAATLEREYNIILSNEDVEWSADYSSRMLELVENIYGFGAETPSKWILTSDEIDDDIEIVYGNAGNVVRINKAAFENAIPRKAQYNGLKGTYFSNRLYHALIRYASTEGTDVTFVDNLLKHEYGCSIIVDDYEALTEGITNETAATFEMFKAEELLAILEMFAEMPEGFHRIENLEYLVRRIDGSKNPIYPDAAAVSWVYAEHGYIEFMDSAFLGSEVEDMFRLVLHEKSHFLWKYVFSDELKKQWAEIGGWYQTSEDSDGWATTKETEFVTAYAHTHNPDEDMAESIAYYILMPDRLESRAPEKYAFIRDYIMNGEIYMTQIREDLTFEVYNLYPDYKYPGRITGVDLQVEGAANEDKKLTVTVTIDTNGDISYGASSAFLRIISDVDTFYDMYLTPINDDHSVLQGTINISKYSCKGYWYCEQITVTDEVGNQRFSGVDSFGWKLYINNSLYDIEQPEYIQDSIYIETEEGMVDGQPVTYVYVKFKAKDNIGIGSVYCEMANNTTNGYRMEQYGTFDNETGEGIITYIFTQYMQSGTYSVNHLSIEDYGRNQSLYNFYSDGTGAGAPVTFEYESDYSDYEAPTLDLNNIIVSAYPTHPENPNGETVVTIDYFVKDNASGLGLVSFKLLDPLGNSHMQYHYHENFYTTFFEGDPTIWTRYQINIILPEGSAPGKWGVLEFYLCDKAGNFVNYNFLEIVHFVIDEEQNEPSFILTTDADYLVAGSELQIVADELDDTKEYVWECQNRTGTATISEDGVLTGLSEGYVTVVLYAVDDVAIYGSVDVAILSDEHNMGDWAVERTGNCQMAGLLIRECQDENCDYFETMKGAIGHTYKEWITDENGHWHECSVCGKTVDYKEHVTDSEHDNTCNVCEKVLWTNGDANGDGSINGRDMLLLRQYLAGGYDITIDEDACDVNNDGSVNGRDMLLLRQYLADGYGVELQ